MTATPCKAFERRKTGFALTFVLLERHAPARARSSAEDDRKNFKHATRIFTDPRTQSRFGYQSLFSNFQKALSLAQM
ncbi:hypothetical protein [Paraburkholderia sacchari]|uniref:hypothetical protein n=1 Tax=Paraburkholderia sacchari TaxID=159450 RepID=UPI0039A75E68